MNLQSHENRQKGSARKSLMISYLRLVPQSVKLFTVLQPVGRMKENRGGFESAVLILHFIQGISKKVGRFEVRLF